MILGIGVDSIEIERVAAKCSAPNSTFMAKMFTEREIARSMRNSNSPYQHLAACFAAREAFFKATQVWYKRQHVSVTQHPWGEPYYLLSTEVAAQLEMHAPLQLDAEGAERRAGIRMLLSLTHDQEYATAFAICEVVESGAPASPIQ
ncbi:MAG: holo-ACP synthase [bacterium]|nr:holo-ACP synthase [bacterium]